VGRQHFHSSAENKSFVQSANGCGHTARILALFLLFALGQTREAVHDLQAEVKLRCSR
jgi:hypothetical protein